MERITRPLKDGPRTFTIYEDDEVDFPVVPWRNAVAGDWGLTDDGYAMECLSSKQYKTNIYKVFSGGSVWLSQKQFNWLEHKASKTYGLCSTKPWKERKASEERIKSIAHAAATMLLNGGRFKWDILAKMYEPTATSAIGQVKSLFKRDWMKNMIRIEVEMALNANQVTNDYVIQLGIDTTDMAKDTKNVSEMGKMFDRWSDLLQLKNGSSGNEIPLGNTGILDAAEDDLKQLPGAMNG